MSLIKNVREKNRKIGSYLKELSLRGIEINSDQADLIIAIMTLINVADAESRSTYSVWDSLDICKKLMYGTPLTPLDNPKTTGEFIALNDKDLQSSRLGSLFSQDGGETWYDIDKLSFKVMFWRFVVEFLKLNPKKHKKRLLPYVKFPYDPSAN